MCIELGMKRGEVGVFGRKAGLNDVCMRVWE